MQSHASMIVVFSAFCGGTVVGSMPNDPPPVQLLRVDDDILTVQWDEAQMLDRHVQKRRFALRGVPVSRSRSVDLELTPFSVAGPDTRFVVTGKDGSSKTFPFDTSRVRAFRGHVRGHVGSDVLLMFGEFQSSGYIDLGPGRNRILLSAKDRNGKALSGANLSIFPAGNHAGFQPPVPYCGVEEGMPQVDWKRTSGVASSSSVPTPATGIRHIELAIDSDYEYFSLFGDRDAAAEYIVQLYTQVSQLFLRDVKAHIELVEVHLRDAPSSDSLQSSGLFSTYDLLQFVSGSRSASYGGIAWGSLCGSGVASEIYYVRGAFPDPTTPSPFHYDIYVSAHELGHNAGAPHTHAAGIDDCANPLAKPQRGSIMSYCQQTYSGLDANQDHYFHRRIAEIMRNDIGSARCIADDCNMNNIEDGLDIHRRASEDANKNGIPDECEDCNGNGVLDDQDIANLTSADRDSNLIPDECEPDCNSNGFPDAADIALDSTRDLYGNGIPDECESDCNGNGTADYAEIQFDMSRDVDRNAVLDICQDCDGDHTTDHAALGGAHNLWIVSGETLAPVREYFSNTGVLVRKGGRPFVSEGHDVVIAPDGRVLVSSAGTNRVQVYDRNAAFIGDFILPGTLGMTYPTGMLVRRDGSLLVASRDTDNILAFDALTGAPIGEFVSAGSGGLSKPYGMTVGPNGNLYITSETNEILEYDGLDGSFVRMFISASANGGLLQPRDLVFKPDGHLLVTSHGTNQVLEYDGATGAPLGSWAVLGFSVSGMTPVLPWGIEIGPNGNVFVARALPDVHDAIATTIGPQPLHFSEAKVFEYDVCNGNFARVHVGGGDTDLSIPTGFTFVPGWDVDCNYNLLPDSCDIASGFSLDLDLSQVPDECEIDCNGNGRLDRLDIIPFGTSHDCNNNLVPDACDITSGTSTDCDSSGIPDECEPDCNGVAPIDSCGFDVGSAVDCDGNNQPDSCEIFEGTALDCNANCVPDGCDPDFDGDGEIDDCDDDIDRDGVLNGDDRCDFTPLDEPVTNEGAMLADLVIDCVIDRRDYGRLHPCILEGGPNVIHTDDCVRRLDDDGDKDNDLRDFAALFRRVGR